MSTAPVHLEGMQVLAYWHSVVSKEPSLRVAQSLEIPAQEKGALLETLPT